MAHWRSTDLSVEAYVREYDIGMERLKYWSRRVERTASGTQLRPVRINTAWLARLLQELW